MCNYCKEGYDIPDAVLEDDELLQEWCQQLGTENVTSSPLRVAGVSFRQDDVKLCKIGSAVNFVPEPDNKFDQHAIKVEVDSGEPGEAYFVGYVPKDCCITVKHAISRPDYKGCRIAKMGKPKGSKHVGIQLALLFEKDPPDLYGGVEIPFLFAYGEKDRALKMNYGPGDDKGG